LAVVDYGANGTAGVTEAQKEAIEEAMKLILEEDHDRGIGPADRFECAGCGITRGLAGAVIYDEVRLCNECATRFEVERTGRKVRTSAEYVRERTKRTA
jgi:hypothetical protein